MTIDLRASTTCNLGRVISGNLGDDYIQGSGLIKTQGSVLIDGLITPRVGSQVVFTYTKQNVPRRIPRAIRVLSSFADPIRQTTRVELGCKLTYLNDLTDPIDWTAFSDPSDVDFTESDSLIITIPIKASTVMRKCLLELGITASSVPLTNNFSIAKFDFSPGYVQVLSDLLVSESYFGYLDQNEVLQIRRLDQNPPNSTVLTQQQIIDLGPIGVGPLPAETVVVSFSSLKLKNPDPASTGPTISWETSESTSNVEAIISYDGPSSVEFGLPGSSSSPPPKLTKTYRGFEITVSRSFYESINGRDVVVQRNVVSQTIAAIAAGGYITEISDLNRSSTITGNSLVNTYEVTTFRYNLEGDEVFRSTSTYKSRGEVAVSAGIKFTQFATGTLTGLVPFPGFGFPTNPSSAASSRSANFSDTVEVSRTTTETEIAADFSRTVTKEYLAPHLTLRGQQYVSSSMEAAKIVGDVTSLLGFILNRKPELVRTTIDVSRKGVNTSQERPTSADLNNAALADGGDPNNGYRTESKSELTLALGSATAQRRIELSMPYAPDDRFTGPTGGPFTSIRSDANQKALTYGRIQNRLLLGNRNGISIQVAPELVPVSPYSGIAINAAGYSALYRVNALQWAFDSSGIVCSTDALYWGLIGST
jgi:hypothetical protein